MAADFITGLYHWVEDNYEVWPRDVLCHNRYHHLYPKAIIQYGTHWGTLWDTFRYSGWLLLPVWFLNGGVFWYTLVLTGSTANLIHSFTHVKKESLTYNVQMLQRIGIFQAPVQHRIHHTGAQNTNYCVMTNYLNPTLEYVRFWRRLEHVLHIISGVKPLEKTDRDIVVECIKEGTISDQYGSEPLKVM